MNNYYNYNTGFDSLQELEMLMPVLIFFLFIWGVFILLGILNYILRGIAIYKMSETRGIQYGWLGFVPYVYNYQFGQIAGEIELGSKKIKKPGLWLLFMPIIYSFVSSIGYMLVMVPYFINIFSLSTDNEIMPEKIVGSVIILMIGIFVFSLIMIVANVFLYLFKYLVLHKIFSQYSVGQKPVFYMIIAMFIPLAESVLLFMHSKRPMLTVNPQSYPEPEARELY